MLPMHLVSFFMRRDRRQGRDHIFLYTHDEGACWAHTEVYNTSIVLTHWGRKDPIHEYVLDTVGHHAYIAAVFRLAQRKPQSCGVCWDVNTPVQLQQHGCISCDSLAYCSQPTH